MTCKNSALTGKFHKLPVMMTSIHWRFISHPGNYHHWGGEGSILMHTLHNLFKSLVSLFVISLSPNRVVVRNKSWKPCIAME